MCGVGKGVGKNSARDFDIYLLASNVGLSLSQSVHIVYARASSLCVSTLCGVRLTGHQAITSSLFQSSTILMLNLFIKYNLQFFFQSIFFTEGQVSVTDTMRVGLQIPGS